MKNKIFFLFLLSFLFMFSVSAFSGLGNGTSVNPFLIESWEQLNETRDNLTANYVLIKSLDQDSTGWSTYNGGDGWESIGGTFSGVLDGNYNTISDLIFNKTGVTQGALITITSGATIKNLGLINTTIDCLRLCGTFVGNAISLTMNNSYSTNGTVHSNNLGNSEAGGLVGSMNSGLINNSYSNGMNIEITFNRAGGLVGEWVGGTLQNSYSNNFVTGGADMGGLVGRFVAGTNVDSFWDNETSGQSTSGLGTGNTTANMKLQTTYTNWDFTNTWAISGSINDGYPYLLNNPNNTYLYSTQYTEDLIGGVSTDILFNITTNDTTTIDSIILQWNGTNTTTSLSIPSTNNYVAASTVSVPIVATETNITFQHYVMYTSFPSLVSEPINQTINNVGLDDCSVFTFELLNLSLFDEVSQSPLNGTIEVLFQVLNPTTFEVIYTLTGQYEGVNETLVCSSINVSADSLIYSAQLRYFATGYEPELYHIQRATLGESETINLYDLSENASTKFSIDYKNSDFVIVPEAIIQLQRQYISEDVFKIVEAPITSSEGNAVLHIDLDSNIYMITVVKNGVVLDVFENIVFDCQSELSGECSQSLTGALNPLNDFPLTTLNDFVYSVSSSGNILSVLFSIPSGVSSLVNLEVTQLDMFGNSSVCNQTVNAAAGTIQCTYNNNTVADSYLTMILKKDGIPQATRTFFIETSDNIDFQGMNFIIVFVMMLSLVGMAFSSPELVVINAVIVFLISGSLYLLNGVNFVVGLGSLMWLVIAVSIMVYKMAKQEDN